jgi:hypothetical protein
MRTDYRFAIFYGRDKKFALTFSAIPDENIIRYVAWMQSKRSTVSACTSNTDLGYYSYVIYDRHRTTPYHATLRSLFKDTTYRLNLFLSKDGSHNGVRLLSDQYAP